MAGMTLDQAVEYAAKHLPSGARISVEVEGGSAWVDLIKPDGDNEPIERGEDGLGEQVLLALHTALQLAEEKPLEPPQTIIPAVPMSGEDIAGFRREMARLMEAEMFNRDSPPVAPPPEWYALQKFLRDITDRAGSRLEGELCVLIDSKNGYMVVQRQQGQYGSL